jgi:hypothetical protein
LVLLIIVSVSVSGVSYYKDYNSPKNIQEREVQMVVEDLSDMVENDYGKGASKSIKIAFCDESIVKVVLFLEREYGFSREVTLQYCWDYDILPPNRDPFETERPKNIERVIQEVERGECPKIRIRE